MEPTSNQPIPLAGKKKINIRFLVVFAFLVIGGGTFGFVKYQHARHHEETDDAQVEADISPVIPRVSGYITTVLVKDNQLVKKGDTLMLLDNRDFVIKVQQAEAAVIAAKNNLGAAE